jgi:DNA-binding winged helix-turn-helix (wHTH) protein
MTENYDVTSFRLDYCREDVSKIVKAIKTRASLLVIGMPGCGKTRLIDFLLRPAVLVHHGLSQSLKAGQVDCNIAGADPGGMYLELLRIFLDAEVDALAESSLTALKSRLLSEVKHLEAGVDLVIIFDNFRASLQQALGEEFFNFLHGLRNARRRLNVSYLFMANLSVNRSGFYQLSRLFAQGPERSTCWISRLNKDDAFFSIDRQLLNLGENPTILSEADKARIYELSGGHALLNKYLSQLMLHDRKFLGEAEVGEVVARFDDIRNACSAIWNDLAPDQRNFLIEVVVQGSHVIAAKNAAIKETLINYGCLKEDLALFSPLFTGFVKEQAEAGEVISAGCDGHKTRIVIKTVNREMSFSLNRLSPKKEGLLPPTTRSLLCYLLAHQAEVCPRDQLIKVGWPLDKDETVFNQALDRQIERIRSWLKEQKELSQYIAIEAVWAVGYKLVVKG